MDHLTKMYTVRKNVCQMLEDRGFLVGEVSKHDSQSTDTPTHDSSGVLIEQNIQCSCQKCPNAAACLCRVAPHCMRVLCTRRMMPAWT